MAIQKPSIPKGTRDFSQAETARRNHIFDTIREVFKLYGYAPIETPAMENLSTLMGKYGEEGDKLLFKVLNSGDFTAGVDPSELKNPNALATKICEKGLRYDLTVPFARYVVQHQSELAFPFKRSQIQPVWRADRPQKGRYREFWQCDADVIGSRSLTNEVELVEIVERVFSRLGIAVTLRLNNRKILAGIAQAMGHADRLTAITVAIDKLDKVGLAAVEAELAEKGISAHGIATLRPILALEGTNWRKLEELEAVIGSTEIGAEGIGEMRTIFGMVEELEIPLDVRLDLSLARGLNYYTGAIFEVAARDFAIGSICGGGRYDDLTGIFGLPGMSGVGISFGADRICDVMDGLGLFPDGAEMGTRVIFLNFGGEGERASLKMVSRLRRAGIPAEMYPDAAKLKKQMDYANRRGIPFAVMAGDDELARGVVRVKDMRSGEQIEASPEKLAEMFK